MVQFSFRPPSADYLGFEATPEGITETACKAEELGFDAVLLNDHIIVDGSPPALPSWGNTYDPLIALSYIAARTTRIRLGTSVLIMPYRNPIATAKMIATLDQLSGGRIIAGVGAGWCEAEFAALGIPFHERGARTTEYLRLWQACWTSEPVTFQGQFFSFSDMYIKPKPLQHPHPPIWIGGSSRAALRRAAEFAKVWQPTQMSVADMHARQVYLREACAKIGRQDMPAIRMSVRVNFSDVTDSADSHATVTADRPIGQGPPAQVAEDLRRLRHETGIEAFQINFNGCQNLAQLLTSMELFMQKVQPCVES